MDGAESPHEERHPNPAALTELLHLPKPWIIAGWQLDPVRLVLTVQVAWPADVAVRCPGCQAACNVHDHREPRHWRHLPCMEYQTWLVCRLPRARCETHGVRTVAVPWNDRSRCPGMGGHDRVEHAPTA